MDRVIISTLATQDPECIRTLAREFGSKRVMPGVDAKGGQIAVHGWQETAGDYLDWAKKFEELGPARSCIPTWMSKGCSRVSGSSR